MVRRPESIYAVAIGLASVNEDWPVGSSLLIGHFLVDARRVRAGGVGIAAVGVSAVAAGGRGISRLLRFERAILSLLALGPAAAALLVYALGRQLRARMPVVPFGAALCVGMALLRLLTMAQL